MKKILLVISAVLTISAQSQTLNPDVNFDGTWITNSNYPAPEPLGWISTNVLTNSFASSSNPVSVTQSTNNCFGGSSMRIETKKFTLGALAGFLPDTCGFAMTGTVVISFSGARLVDGYPFTSKPTYLTYCYQAQPQPGDTCGLGVLFWKWNGATRTIVGGGLNQYSTSNASMTNATLNIIYTSTVTPDSMAIYAGSSYKFPTTGTTIRKGAKEGSRFFVDNIFYPGVGVNSINANEIKLSVFPVPATNQLKVVTDNYDAKSILITDLSGKIIESLIFENGKLNIPVSNYQNGVYLYSVLGNSGQTLKTGKFTVNR